MQAALVTQTTSVHLTFRDCVAGSTVCSQISPVTQGLWAGVGGDAAAGATQTGTNPDRAVSGSATLLGAGASRLEGSSTSAARTRDSSNSYSLQRYTYNGAGPATLVFSGSLAYNQTVPAENADFPQTSATSSLAVGYMEVFTLSDATIDTGLDEFDNWLALGGRDALPGYSLRGSDFFQSPGVTGAGSADLSVLVHVSAGDSVWLYALLQTPAVNGAMVEASLDTALRVPEPGSLSLAGLCLLGLAASARRRRRTTA